MGGASASVSRRSSNASSSSSDPTKKKDGVATTIGFGLIALVYLLASSTQLPAVTYVKHELKFQHTALLLCSFFLFQALCLPAYFVKRVFEAACGAGRASARDEKYQRERRRSRRRSVDEEAPLLSLERCAGDENVGRPRARTSGAMMDEEASCSKREDGYAVPNVVLHRTRSAASTTSHDAEAMEAGRANAGPQLPEAEEEEVRPTPSAPQSNVHPEYPVKSSCFLIGAGAMEVLSKICQIYAIDHLGTSYVMLLSATKLIFVALQRSCLLKADWPVKAQLLGMALVLFGITMSQSSVILDDWLFPNDVEAPPFESPWHRGTASGAHSRGDEAVRPVRAVHVDELYGVAPGIPTPVEPLPSSEQPETKKAKKIWLGVLLALLAQFVSSFGFVFQECSGRLSPKKIPAFLATGIQGCTSFVLAIATYAVLVATKKQQPISAAWSDIAESGKLQILFFVFFVIVLVAAVCGMLVSRQSSVLRVLLENARPVLVYFVEPFVLVSDNLGRRRFCHDRIEAWVSPLGHVAIVVGVLAYFEWGVFRKPPASAPAKTGSLSAEPGVDTAEEEEGDDMEDAERVKSGFAADGTEKETHVGARIAKMELVMERE